MHFTAMIGTNPPPQAAGTWYFAMDVEDLPAAVGSRPDGLLDVSGPQERDQRRSVVQIVDSPLVVPSLNVPVPLLVEQTAEILQFFDALSPVAEQVIDVLLAEQLVEVPSVLYFLKQKVDIPVPGGGERPACLHAFHPEQSSTAPPFSEQIVDIPAPGGGLQGFRIRRRHLLLSLQLVYMRTRMSIVKGFFALFPRPEKVRRSHGTRVRECPGASAHPR